MLRWNLAGLVLLVGAGVSRADDDVIRLGGVAVGADTIRLGGVGADDADTELVYRRGYGYGGYGYRGYGFGGYGRSFGFGYYGRSAFYGGGYRHGWYGGYRGNWGGYHRPFYYSGYRSFAPYYSFGYRPYIYAQPSYYYYPSYSYFIDPCVGDAGEMPQATRLGTSRDFEPAERLGGVFGTAPGKDGTYRYDGGPSQVVPIPTGGAAPVATPPPPALPRDFKLVVAPATPKLSYAAYGETAAELVQPVTTKLVSNSASPAPLRVSFPAYGETAAPGR